MSTIQQLVLKNTQVPVRRLYIKRRFLDGTYEPEWLRIDWMNSKNRVNDWGNLEISIDSDPGEIANFEVSGITFSMINTEGEFNVETNTNSKWYGYLNRRFTKIKCDCGYIDSDGSEVGVTTVFEGIINRVTVSEDQLATLECLSYTSILTQYDISDLNLTATTTVSGAVNLIMNQPKITTYIPYVPASNTLNPVFGATDYSGTYWDVLKKLAQESASVPYLNGSIWSFQDRKSSAGVVFNFLGQGVKNSNINLVTQYDDEGADRVRVYWKAKDSTVFVQSSDALLLKKYLGAPQEIELNNYNDDYKEDILTTYLLEWQNPKPTITFTTRFALNLINVLDKISIRIDGIIKPTENQFILGSSILGGENVLVGAYGGVVIYGGADWIVTNIQKDIQNWTMTIKAERITQ